MRSNSHSLVAPFDPPYMGYEYIETLSRTVYVTDWVEVKMEILPVVVPVDLVNPEIKLK